MGVGSAHNKNLTDPCSAGAYSVLVLGLGNSLLGDDGTGPQVITRLHDSGDLPASTTLLDGGTLSFTLLGDIEASTGLIAVDAAQLEMAPGTVEVFEGEAMDSFLRSGKCSSVHEVSLAELLDMARLTQRLPERRALVAVQPEHIGWATELSPAVDLGLQLACTRIHDLLARWSA